MSARRRTIAALAMVAAVALGVREARASCGADGCLLDLRGPEFAEHGRSIDVSYQLVDMDEVRIGSRQAAVGEIPGRHNEVRTRSESWTVTARAAVREWLSVSASMPWIDRLHAHQHEHHPGFYEEQEWRYAGAGDLTLLGFVTPQGSGPRNPLSLTFTLGVKAPTGKRNVAEVDGDQPEPMARPGSGSWDGVAGVQIRRWVETPGWGGPRPMPFAVGVLGRVNGDGTERFRMGNELQLHLSGGWAVASAVSVLGQVNTRWRARDVEDDGGEHERNSGGVAVLVTPGLSVGLSRAINAYAYVQARAFERLNGIQLSSPVHTMIGTSYRF
jgi:hypothetical protein